MLYIFGEERSEQLAGFSPLPALRYLDGGAYTLQGINSSPASYVILYLVPLNSKFRISCLWNGSFPFFSKRVSWLNSFNHPSIV